MSADSGVPELAGKIDPAAIDLPRFMVGWRGEPDRPAIRLPAEHQWLPEPLKDWYELTARWTSPSMNLKHMLTPAQIKATGKAVEFMTDPTGDWIWAFDLDDPQVVYDRELYEPWTRTAEDLPEFLVHNALNLPDRPARFEVQIASSHPDRLDRLDALSDIRWFKS